MNAREPMSPVDTAWLRMDRPQNLMQILGVMLFAGRVDAARLQRTLAQRIVRYRRFRQLAVEDADGVCWVDDPHFAIDRHLRHCVLPAPGGSAALHAFVAEMASTPLNPARPRWQFDLVELAEEKAALVVRVHHALADGIALVKVIDALTDDRADAPEAGDAPAAAAAGAPSPAAGAPSPAASAAPAAGDGGETAAFAWQTLLDPLAAFAAAAIRSGGRLWGQVQALRQEPAALGHYARVGAAIAREIGALAALADDSATRFKGKATTCKCVAWSAPLDLGEIKAVSKVLGCSVNDVLLAVLAGALRAYLLDKGDAVEAVALRAMVPVNLRGAHEAEELGNHFGLVAIELPLGIANPLSRLYATRARMQARKESYQAMLTLTLLDAVGRAPQVVQEQLLGLLTSKATAVVTNVPGSPQARFFAGTRIDQELVWVPQAGDIGIGAAILSYAGRVQFGLLSDRALVDDPAWIVHRCADEFATLLWLVLLEPPQRLADPLAVERSVAVAADAGAGVA